jgi:hypothetical protein
MRVTQKQVNKAILDEALSSWEALNNLMKTAQEELCQVLLKAELAGRRRLMFVLRIYSRLNRVRAARERQELREKL